MRNKSKKLINRNLRRIVDYSSSISYSYFLRQAYSAYCRRVKLRRRNVQRNETRRVCAPLVVLLNSWHCARCIRIRAILNERLSRVSIAKNNLQLSIFKREQIARDTRNDRLIANIFGLHPIRSYVVNRGI